ncbi:MAG: tRNA (adenosine(37)-N6)-threonylcarbamoyltransferase complex dimerization subunit type 1 TsaB [Akkermansia sp.]|nr:tRNA (adenosine(37)-N6)-threonylcarbamoyltransferase complex dimerization subunit type 1 TsaB [Akkermansia sp.]
MNLLAIETSVTDATLCLYRDGAFAAESAWHAERNHDAFLFPALQRALDTLGDSPLDAVLVGAGPGSYGGVRVALAAGVGISMVRGARLVTVPSWDQLAKDGECIVSDAKRGGWTLRKPDGTISVITTEELQALLESGMPVASVETSEALQKRSVNITRCGLVSTARGLVETWLGMDDSARDALAAKPAEPIYVRPPHITDALRKPWEFPH